MQDQVTMAEVTREARVRAGLSMRGLARRSGLSAAQVSRIEAGEVERPVAETLVKLAKALDRDAQLLLVFAGHISGARARQLFSGQITPDDPELRQLLEAWRQLEHERRKKVLDFSQDQLALSLLRVEKDILGSVQTPEEAFELVRNPSAGESENGHRSHSPSAKRPPAKSKRGR